MAETEAPSEEGTRERLLPKKPSNKGSYLNEILFGLINVIVGVPTMVSYAAVVFKVMAFLYVLLTQCLARWHQQDHTLCRWLGHSATRLPCHSLDDLELPIA